MLGLQIEQIRFTIKIFCKCFILILGVFVFSCGNKKTAPPNIVLIFTDDQGYADVGVYGAVGFKTPNIDRLAREGIRFTDFQVAQAVCSASRAALLTGCYSERLGVLGAYNHTARVGLNPDETTIAEMLKPIGYTTAIFGKWHLGHHKKFLPLQQGFDEYFGLPYSNDMWPVDYDGTSLAETDHRKSFYPQLPLLEGNEKVEEIRTLADQDELTRRYTERAVDFIDRNSGTPFFLYLPHSMPHVPLGVSEKFRGKSEQGVYGDVMMEIDWSVGEILKALERHGIEDNTLVIFTSDNGPWLNYGDHAGSVGSLREGKGTMWEGGSRVPCIMRWPNRIPDGTVSNKLAATIDILPTIASVTGATLPDKTIDGVNLQRILEGDVDFAPRQSYYYYYSGELIAAREGDMKLVFPHTYRSYENVKPGKDGYPGKYARSMAGLELYDLANDLGERNDIASEFPELVKKLEQLGAKARYTLGDRLKDLIGNEVRQIGRIDAERSASALSVRHKGIGKSVSLGTRFSEQYTAGGLTAVVDGRRGTLDHHDGTWQGYSGNDFQVTIDLGENVSISEIGVSFLQKQSAWIFFPTKVSFKVSSDGHEFTSIKQFEIQTTVSDSYEVREFKHAHSQTTAKFVRIVAQNVGLCPKWHPGAGSDAWIFVDEVIIN